MKPILIIIIFCSTRAIQQWQPFRFSVIYIIPIIIILLFATSASIFTKVLNEEIKRYYKKITFEINSIPAWYTYYNIYLLTRPHAVCVWRIYFEKYLTSRSWVCVWGWVSGYGWTRVIVCALALALTLLTVRGDVKCF